MQIPATDILRARVPGFVRAHYLWPGTLRLHGAALGADVLRAPVNILLGPVFVLTRAAGWLAARLGRRRLAGWLGARRVLLRTAVAARVEAAVWRDLLAAPADDPVLTRLVADYAATRAPVGEITTALLAVLLGASLWQTLTPGMVSLAPGLAQSVAERRAIAEFPLGQGLGGLWYGVFPAGAAPWMLGAALVLLMMTGAIVTAFAGVIADPVQVWTGVHRRRLLRLVSSIDAARQGADHPFASRDHLVARGFDLLDGALSLLRVWRG